MGKFLLDRWVSLGCMSVLLPRAKTIQQLSQPVYPLTSNMLLSGTEIHSLTHQLWGGTFLCLCVDLTYYQDMLLHIMGRPSWDLLSPHPCSQIAWPWLCLAIYFWKHAVATIAKRHIILYVIGKDSHIEIAPTDAQPSLGLASVTRVTDHCDAATLLNSSLLLSVPVEVTVRLCDFSWRKGKTCLFIPDRALTDRKYSTQV